MSGNLGGWTGLIVLVVVLLLFGAPKLPALAKSLGQSLKIFKSEVRPGDDQKDQAGGAPGSEGPDTPKQ
jgi:sec-independent protein translocase protein TatA